MGTQSDPIGPQSGAALPIPQPLSLKSLGQALARPLARPCLPKCRDMLLPFSPHAPSGPRWHLASTGAGSTLARARSQAPLLQKRGGVRALDCAERACDFVYARSRLGGPYPNSLLRWRRRCARSSPTSAALRGPCLRRRTTAAVFSTNCVTRRRAREQGISRICHRVARRSGYLGDSVDFGGSRGLEIQEGSRWHAHPHVARGSTRRHRGRRARAGRQAAPAGDRRVR